jgi:hypothetical protein
MYKAYRLEIADQAIANGVLACLTGAFSEGTVVRGGVPDTSPARLTARHVILPPRKLVVRSRPLENLERTQQVFVDGHDRTCVVCERRVRRPEMYR